MIEFVVRYILDENFINRLFLFAAIGGPIIGFFTGIIIDRCRINGFKYTFLLTSIGLLGTLNLILWKLYNIFTDYFGLATVKNLLFNLVFFVISGAIAGFFFALLYKHFNRDSLHDKTF